MLIKISSCHTGPHLCMGETKQNDYFRFLEAFRWETKSRIEWTSSRMKSGKRNKKSSQNLLGNGIGDSTLRSIAFGATMLGSSALNNLFVTYYLELFTSVALVSSWWFYCVQFLFGIWNAVNDPLFGWLSDAKVLQSGWKRTDGVLWSAAFLLTWYPWPSAWGSPQGGDSLLG